MPRPSSVNIRPAMCGPFRALPSSTWPPRWCRGVLLTLEGRASLPAFLPGARWLAFGRVDPGQQRGDLLLVRLELTGQPGGFLAGLASLLACLVAFGLGGSHSLGHAVSLGGVLFALFLGGLFLVSQSGAQLGGLDACGLLGRLDGRQAGLQFLDLG